MRHPQAESGDAGVLLDYPAQDARRNENRRRVGGVHRLLQLGQSQFAAGLGDRLLG